MITGYRKHQLKAKEIAQQIHAGGMDKKFIVAHVTPGGGKTLMASIFAHELLKQDVDRVIVVCPRKSLQLQMVNGFRVPSLGLLGGLELGYSPNGSLLKNERAGAVTTYQDVVANPRQWRKLIADRPTLLILDESHHLQRPGWGVESGIDKGWSKAIVPLASASKRVLLMTGTMRRENNAPLAFVDYDEETRIPVIHIEYTRRDALSEKAILHVDFKVCDGKAEYWHSYNKQRHVLSQVSAKEESRALNTLLNDEDYRNRLIELALSDFARYRDMSNPNAQMLIICASQLHARQVTKYITASGSYRPVLAISDEAGSHSKVARFRDRHEGDVLVTCQIAYEGLDIPGLTHLIALTNFRSRSWLEQALSRCTRFDPKCNMSWENQLAYLYVPSDPSMKSFINEWLDEQDARCGEAPESSDATVPRGKSTYYAESGELTEIFHGTTDGMLSDSDHRRIAVFDKRYPYISHMPTIQRLKIARDMWPTDDVVPGVGEVS